MKTPLLWSKHDLYRHLQHAVDVEFWTIPLYLTSLYSIKELKGLKQRDYPDSAKLIQSVVIQEMLHLELICNICNALGYSPLFHTPQYDDSRGIPFIHPLKETLPHHLRDYSCKPGALNESSLKLFCAIELPQKKVEINWEEKHTYHSIAEMYAALQEGIFHFWNECYVGDKYNTKQKKSFHEYHNKEGKNHGFSQEINSIQTVLKAMEAIIEQGEGADNKVVPADFRPPKLREGKEFDPGWFKGHLSHYQKFSMLLHHHKKLPGVYEVIEGAEAMEEQAKLNISFRVLLDELSKSFNSDGIEMTPEFWNIMFRLTNDIIAVWEKGAIPQYQSV